MLPCFSKQLFDMDCPGCGLQRSIALLLSGDFLAAFKMYPAIYTLIPLFGILVLSKVLYIKFSDKLIMWLSIASVTLILTNFIINLLTH
ncbi:DUF2752 domain-containing protein [uncultured Croceitalea sp.]|uniref:DUF2752 domain-containing protein n=1 Tax=uncultured Croceitalea sp. TaxID=1798908 RepID=UPI0033060E8E